jgi:hypothetical protein
MSYRLTSASVLPSPATQPSLVEANNVSLLTASVNTRQDVRSILNSSLVKSVINDSKKHGLYRNPIPNNQDAQNNAVAGLGGKFLDSLPLYVFSTRRQTDQMVRQAYELLPSGLKRDVAFVHAQRVAQDPEGAARMMYGKKQVVIVGSLKGVNTATSLDPKVAKIHEQELKALELSLKLAKAMKIEVRDIVYGMGDSSPTKIDNQYSPIHLLCHRKNS